MRKLWWAWLGLGGLLVLGFIRVRAQRTSGPRLSPGPRPAPSTDWRELYLDGSPAAEAELFNRFALEIKQVQSRLAARAHAPQPLRAFHAKMQAGITNAEFRVAERLPQELQVGLFKPGATYRATVRLSNASGMVQSDAKRDLRGLAVRLHLDDGSNQDFLMTNAPASHARDARQFMVAATALANDSRVQVLLQLLRGLGLRETVRMLLVIVRSARVVDSLAVEQYSSRSPLMFGPYAAKLRFQPQPDVQAGCKSPRGRTGENFLRDDLVARLRQGPVVWDLQIQRYVDPERTPIEDGTVEWQEADAPPETVGQLVIPRQDLTTAAADSAAAAVEALEFSPWNFTEGLKPLSSLNRARRGVYAASADFRANRAPDELLRESPFWSNVWVLTEGAYRVVNRFVPWHRLPPFLGAVNLAMLRRELRRHNLHDTSPQVPATWPPQVEHRFLVSRASDGRFNDLAHPEMGSAGFRFGRNVPLADAFPGSDSSILDPNPREISERLLARKEFVPATTLNLLAAAWIQFQVHDWVSHKQASRDTAWRIPVRPDDSWGEDAIVVRRTEPDTTPAELNAGLPPAYSNQGSHWWDGSQIYGSDQKTTDKLRDDHKGYLRIDEQTTFLPIDPETHLPITGVTDNWWVGLTILHNVFAKEHNAICDMLLREHPSWTDQRTFDVARLINVALMAKIHTVEWTPAILAHPTLKIGMEANWCGLAGAGLQRVFGRLTSDEVISGIPGSIRDHAGIPYALTEEFAAVYRLHPLIPDRLNFRHLEGDDRPSTWEIADTAFAKAQDVLNHYTLPDLIYSFAISHPGAVTLKNYPQFLRNLTLPPGPNGVERLDLAAVDILRDRERGVPRYNRFRELLHRGRVRSFAEITSNREWAEELEQVYRDVDKVDLMVGLFAEDAPQGFGFSDTAFRIFILMASRRLKSDRFFTTDWRPEVYSREGMEWITNNGMTSVLMRHYPELAPVLRTAKNAFAPWV
jgi:hypothetical protein